MENHIDNCSAWTLSPILGKAWCDKLNKKINIQVTRRLELNDQACISVNKLFYSSLIEAVGYDKLTFREEDYRIILIKLDH